jgi:hypothetical protein
MHADQVGPAIAIPTTGRRIDLLASGREGPLATAVGYGLTPFIVDRARLQLLTDDILCAVVHRP